MESYTYGVYGELLSGNVDLTHFLYNGRCGVSTEANGLYYMRQRYYNPDIKRFINQDILAGSLDNSQSLNQYSYVQGNPVSYTDPFGLSPVNGLFSDTNFAHSLLNLLSCIPGFVGSTASAIDGLVYAVVDKDYSMMALCFMDAASFGIGKVGSKLLKAKKYTNTAETLINASHLMSNAANFGMCINDMMDTGFSMYDKYYIQGQSADSNTKWEVLSLGMSALECVVAGRGVSKSTKSMSNLLQQEGFTNALKGEVMEMASGIKRSASAIMADNSGSFRVNGLASAGKSASSASSVGMHSGKIAAESNEVSRESIIRALRQSNTAEGIAYAKMIKREIINLKIEPSHRKGYGGLYIFGTNDIHVYTNVANSPTVAAGYAAHETTHYLQRLTSSTYRRRHEFEAYMVQRKVDKSFLLRTEEAIWDLINTNPAYANLKQ